MILPIAFIFKLLTRFRGERDNNRQIATRIFWGIVATLALIGLILFFRSCGKPTPAIDEKAVQDSIQRQKQINDAELDHNLQYSEQKVSEIDANVKASEANTKAATANKSKGVTGKQLDEMARDEK